MDVPSLCYSLIIALLPLVYFLKSYAASARAKHHGLRLPPGPWRLPVVGSLHHLAGALPHRRLRDLSRRHGPLMFLKFAEVPVVVASSRDAAREVLRTHDAVFATRPQTKVSRILTKQGQSIALAPYGDHWRRLRRICVLEILSARRVQSLRLVREDEAARLLRAVASASAAAPPLAVNLSELLATFVADTTMREIMGYRLRECDAFLRCINEAIRLIGGFSLADFFPSSRLAGALCWTTRRAEVYQKDAFAFLGRIIEEHIVERRKHEETFPEGLIDTLLKNQSPDSPHGPLTMGTIKAIIFDLVSAGSEAVAATLQWAMAELMRNPSVMSRVQAEVREAFTSQMKVTEEGVSKLSYLHLVVKETLRLHVPGPLLIPRQCKETCQVLGYDVPKGAMVLVNAWAIARDARYWDEPETFNPERFEHDTRDFKGTDFEFTPFGAGRRICPGMLFGLANVELALANLLFYFDWGLPEGSTDPNDLDMTESMGITARKKRDLWLRGTPHVPLPC